MCIQKLGKITLVSNEAINVYPHSEFLINVWKNKLFSILIPRSKDGTFTSDDQ